MKYRILATLLLAIVLGIVYFLSGGGATSQSTSPAAQDGLVIH